MSIQINIDAEGRRVATIDKQPCNMQINGIADILSYLSIAENIYFKQADTPDAEDLVFTVGPGGFINLVHSSDIHTEWTDSDSTLWDVPEDTFQELLSVAVTEDVATAQGSWAIGCKVSNTGNRDAELYMTVKLNGTALANQTVSVLRDETGKSVLLSGATGTDISENDTLTVEFSSDRDTLQLNGDTSPTKFVLRKTTGTVTASDFGSYAWDDIIQPVMGKLLDSSSGKLDPDWQNKGIKLADSTVITNDTHKLHWGYQINHKFKLDGLCHPHIHWLQSQADSPNWWLRWRIWQNGQEAGPWHEIALDKHDFIYSSGTIMQISYNENFINFANEVPGGLNVSDFLDVELTRDSNNDSGLFSGADPVSGNVVMKGFDPHLQVDAAGSRLELVK